MIWSRLVSWAQYRQTADHPNWFTRWMLERTLVVLSAQLDNAPTSNSNAATLRGAQQSILAALQQPPLEPPVPVDTKVDMLWVVLGSAQAASVTRLFAQAENLPTGAQLDVLQAKRKNPWGGFLEAWLEHYNHLTDCANNTPGSVQMAETEVQSEVAGTVWKVHVAVGDAVKNDQELMILESMKMEIPVDAPCAGTVVALLVAPEEGIEEDQVLLVIEN